ncbi:hypothetical protein HPB51_028411 [Rhipicephalus microplus]|uniref:Uncharacterized protein n=1 Tax=Rhipicephalus microplus TaxID=6941 RepID=A0A9J6CXK9_RHIMP|nr:hypothetical protein HPB51_028411 [Rhipicephalus microplus]
MTTQDVDALFRLVSMVTDSQQYSLDTLRIRWLPWMNGRRSSKAAVRALRKAVEKCPFHQTRLERLAFLYCWLSPLPPLRPWTLMRFSTWAANGMHGLMTLLKSIDKAMKILGRKTTFMVTEAVTCVLGCIMAEDTDPEAPVHVICVCLWSFLPYFAVYAPHENVHSELSIALAALLDCDPTLLVCGIYESLGSARSGAFLDAVCWKHKSSTKKPEKRLRDINLEATSLLRSGNEISLQ